MRKVHGPNICAPKICGLNIRRIFVKAVVDDGSGYYQLGKRSLGAGRQERRGIL